VNNRGLSAAGGAGEAELLAAGGIDASVVAIDDGAVALRPSASGWEVLAWAPAAGTLPRGLGGEASESGGGHLLIGPADRDNALALRTLIPWLRPRLVGPGRSFGTGDRFGLATPGHVAAFRAHDGIAPVFAQQSARELQRTARSFRDVLDGATFGALASGWREGYGADADHLKSLADIDAGIAAGFTMFTADPIELVPHLPADAPDEAIARALSAVPWAALEDDLAGFEARYPERLDLDTGPLELPRPALRAAAARFGAAVVQITTMYRHLAAGRESGSFEFEVAVDEVEHRTTPVDHVYLATELRRLGVRWVSFAPRFVGRFEKGIDYVGDPAAFEADVALHAAIARIGPYKLSVHSGSDKFSIYAAVAAGTRGPVHLKTSGTSYLVALQTIAAVDPELMRRVWQVALKAYSTARASYHVSAALPRLLAPEALSAVELAGLFDEPDTREILHVTYGAVLHGEGAPGNDVATAQATLGDDVRRAIWEHREAYWAGLADHISRHLRPFADEAGGSSKGEA
jgi:hypothetical protein